MGPTRVNSPNSCNSPEILSMDKRLSHLISMIPSGNFERIYSIVKAAPSLLHHLAMKGFVDGKTPTSLLWIIVCSGIHKPRESCDPLDLALQLIELDPRVNIDVETTETWSDGKKIILSGVLSRESSEKRTKLLKYLLLLGVKIPRKMKAEHLQEIDDIKVLMKKDFLRAMGPFKLYKWSPEFTEFPYELMQHISMDLVHLQYPELAAGCPRDFITQKICEFLS